MDARRRLTLNLGIRFEHDTAYSPEQCREAGPFAAAQCWDEIELVTFNSVAPRAHLAFDVMGDGKTVLKGGMGASTQLRELMPDLTSDQSERDRDDDWNGTTTTATSYYEAGEVNLDPNGPDYRGTYVGTTWAWSTRTRNSPRPTSSR